MSLYKDFPSILNSFICK
jgi:hypothetical protein